MTAIEKKSVIPVYEPELSGNELSYVSECINSGWISSQGEFINRFESEFASYCGRKFGIAVTSGTTALQLALAALTLPKGSEVILPGSSIISSALAVIYNKLVPVFVDVDPLSWGLDPSQLEKVLSPRTKAIMPVHLFGHPVNMQPVLDFARQHNLAIVEDAAQAHGAEYSGMKCGSFGSMSCFSFYANKIITSGEGGMVLTDDQELYERCRSMRNLCFRSDRRFYHTETGFNFRFTNLQAALGLAQLEKIGATLNRKRQLAMQYSEKLKDIVGIQLPIEREWAKNVYWMYAIVLRKKSKNISNASELADQLWQHKIQTRPFFLGLHRQPCLQKYLTREYRLPVTDSIAENGLYLPSSMALTENQVERVCEAIRGVFST